MAKSVHDFTVSTIRGADKKLADYKGKVLLVVNVASECGLTPQYAGLEKLHEEYASKGFAVLGFPANEFGAQEPGTEAEIKEFCSTKYDVTFPLFAKIVVKGAGQHPLYAALTHDQPEAKALPGSNFRAKLVGYGVDPGGPSEILWNFEKFVVDRAGNVVARFAPDVPPDAPIVVAAIERELAVKPTS